MIEEGFLPPLDEYGEAQLIEVDEVATHKVKYKATRNNKSRKSNDNSNFATHEARKIGIEELIDQSVHEQASNEEKIDTHLFNLEENGQDVIERVTADYSVVENKGMNLHEA